MLGDSVAAKAIAGVFSVTSFAISIHQIVMHLRNYTEPTFQRYIVRIIFMVPLYSIGSFLSIILSDQHIYFDTTRDLYEAWILYNFLALCLAYVGGPGEVVTKRAGEFLETSWICCTCCLPSTPINGQFLRRCKQGVTANCIKVIQFVLIKPILAVVTLVLYNLKDGDGTRRYEEGDWSVDNGYLWVQLLYNICYTLALYALIVFYQGTEPLLAPFKPLLKFVLIKAVVFLTFWQGLVISLMASWGTMDSAEDAKDLQNFLICIEMLFAAILLLYAFPYREYMIAGADTRLGTANVRHAFSIRDVVTDTVHHFAPQYHDYVLYSDDTTAQPVKKTVRTRTFVKVGDETTRIHDRANLLASTEPTPTVTTGDDSRQEIELPAVVVAEEMDEPRPSNQSPTPDLV